MEEEHVVDNRQANYLRWGAEEALEGAHRGETGIVGGESSSDCENERKKLGPEENRKSDPRGSRVSAELEWYELGKSCKDSWL